MSVKTIDHVQCIVPARNQAPTYSVGPSLKPIHSAVPSAASIELFLEGENPLGCIRGVMWVMAFNVAVALLGVLIWQSCKFLL